MTPRNFNQISLTRRYVLQGMAGSAVIAALGTAGWTSKALAGPPQAEMGAEGTISSVPADIVIFFNKPEEPATFEAYYHDAYVPAMLRLPNVRKIEGCMGVQTVDGHEAGFYRMAKLCFASLADLEKCAGSPAGIAAFAEVMTFATGGATATIVHDITSFEPTAVAPSPINGFEDPRQP